jgi:hypothetical protein
MINSIPMYLLLKRMIRIPVAQDRQPQGSFFAPRHTASLLLDNCSCIALLPSIHGHMRCPTTVHGGRLRVSSLHGCIYRVS